MASEQKNDILLVIRAVDRVTKPVKEIRERIEGAFRPLKSLGKVLGKNLALGEIADKFGGVREAAGRVGSQIGSLVARFAGLALGAGAAFYTIVHGAMEAGDELAKNAGRVGLSVDAYASLEYSAKQADVTSEEFRAGLDKLNKQMGEFSVGSGGEYLKFLNEVSPAFAKQMKSAKTTEQALALLTDAFAKIPDPQRRAELSAKSFGKSNLQMAEWLKRGGAAIQAQQLKFAGLVGSQEKSAQAASDLDNAVKDLSAAFFGAQNSIASAFFPVLTELAGRVTGFLTNNRASLAAWAEKGAAAFKAWLDSGGFERLVHALGSIADGVGKVVNWLGPMGTAFAAATVVLAPLAASLFSLGGALISLGTSLAPVIVAAAPILAVVAALGALAYLGKTIYDNWEGIVFLFKDWGNTLRWAVLDTWDKVRPILEKISAFSGGLFGGAEVKVGDFIADKLRPSSPALGSPAAARPAMAPTASSSESTVNVNFSNLPKGARVSSPDGDANVNVSAGWSMVTQ